MAIDHALNESGICPDCKHPRVRHVEDGTGATCVVCTWIAEQATKGIPVRGLGGTRSGRICTRKFQFKLSAAEQEQAVKANKEDFKPWIVCGICYYDWQQHDGYLCPTGDSTFVPLFNKNFLVTKEN